jgi:hypothetical protein
MQTHASTTVCGLPPPPPIQFYSIQLTPLEGGQVAVGIGATFCETSDDAEFELVHMEVASERVDTIDHALSVIRHAVTSTMQS